MSDAPHRTSGSPHKEAPDAATAAEREAAKAKAKDEADAKAAEEAKAKAAADQRAADTTDEAADDTPAEPEGQDPDDPKFSVSDLVANARTLTGYGKYVLAGALSKLEGDAFTVAEAKEAVEGFVSTPIDPDASENLTEVDPKSGAVTVAPTVEPTPEESAEES
jgi:hypothetical protein